MFLHVLTSASPFVLFATPPCTPTSQCHSSTFLYSCTQSVVLPLADHLSFRLHSALQPPHLPISASSMPPFFLFLCPFLLLYAPLLLFLLFALYVVLPPPPPRVGFCYIPFSGILDCFGNSGGCVTGIMPSSSAAYWIKLCRRMGDVDRNLGEQVQGVEK